MKKKILIDVTSTVPHGKNSYISGIGKSTYWLVNALNKKENLPFNMQLYTIGVKNISFNFYDWNFEHNVIPFPASLHFLDMGLSSLWRKFFLNYDLYHLPGNIDYTYKGEQFVATIHDCDRFSTTKDLEIKKKYINTAEKSRGIVTCSEFSKSEIIKNFNIDPSKVSVIYWGIDLHLFTIKQNWEKKLQKFNIHVPYFFACSCNAPRKNIITALRAFKKFLSYNPKHVFVLAWGNPPKSVMNEFVTEIEQKKIIFLPYVDDDDLVALYNGASLSIYISRREGFGFPILESYACGTPVLVCDNSCIPEIAQDAGIYVGEDAIDEIVDVMLYFDKEKFDTENFKIRSQNILNKFTWEKTADNYVKFYSKYL